MAYPRYIRCLYIAALLTLAPMGAVTAADPPTLSFNTTGDLFVIDDACGCILRITPGKNVSLHLSRQQIRNATGASDVAFDFVGLAFDAAGVMYFSESESDTILKQTRDGTLTVLVTEVSLLQAVGSGSIDINALVFGADGTLYAVDFRTDSVLAIDPQSGTVDVLVTKQDFNSVLDAGETMRLDAGLAADDGSSLYVSSGPTPAVFRISIPDGAITRVASGDPLVAPWWYGTRAPNGDLLFSDNETILARVTEKGVVSTFLTAGQVQAVTGQPAKFDSGLAFDSAGDLYLGEFNSGHILRVTQSEGVAQDIEIWVPEAELLAVTGAVETKLRAAIAYFPALSLYFAQFGNGTGAGALAGLTFSADIVLPNPSATDTVNGTVAFADPDGNPFVTDVEGSSLTDAVDFTVPPLDSATISTTGKGELATGSAKVVADGPLGGVIRFEISDFPGVGSGIAGVPASQPLTGFVTPVRRVAGGINTAVAVRNVGTSAVTLNLSLRQGDNEIDTATRLLPGNGRIAEFINTLFPNTDTSNFTGTLVGAVDDGMIAGTALEQGTGPGEFTTLPITPLE